MCEFIDNTSVLLPYDLIGKCESTNIVEFRKMPFADQLDVLLAKCGYSRSARDSRAHVGRGVLVSHEHYGNHVGGGVLVGHEHYGNRVAAVRTYKSLGTICRTTITVGGIPITMDTEQTPHQARIFTLLEAKSPVWNRRCAQ